MKTLKAWEKSRLNLAQYLQIPCQINEELYNYIGEIVSPQYCLNGFVQLGEAEYSDEYTSYYITAAISNGKYYYLGILPEFK